MSSSSTIPPTTMKAAVLHKIGDPTSSDVLSVAEDVPVPSPGKGEILIKVKAAAINPIDWRLMNGSVMAGPITGPVEASVGCDVSGIVARIGPETTTELRIGDGVFGDALQTKGSFAEYCVVQEIALAKKPQNVTFEEAAALPLAGLTAIQGLLNVGSFKEGDKVLIYGGTGGVGSLAVQAAKAMGASEVYSTGSQVDAIKGLGADVVINYKEQSLMDGLKGQNFDIVYDTIGGSEHYEVGLASMKPTATYVTLVGRGGTNSREEGDDGPKFKFFLTDTSAPGVRETMKKLADLVERGKVKAVLDESKYVLTTDSIHDLVKASMGHRAKGKLVVTVA